MRSQREAIRRHALHPNRGNKNPAYLNTGVTSLRKALPRRTLLSCWWCSGIAAWTGIATHCRTRAPLQPDRQAGCENFTSRFLVLVLLPPSSSSFFNHPNNAEWLPQETEAILDQIASSAMIAKALAQRTSGRLGDVWSGLISEAAKCRSSITHAMRNSHPARSPPAVRQAARLRLDQAGVIRVYRH